MGFLLLLETLFTFNTKQDLSEFNGLAIFLHKLDIEIQTFESLGHSKDERLETLDASLAANIIQARLKTIDGEINDLDDIHGS